MKVTAKRTSETHADVHIVMDDKDLAPALERAIERLAKDVKIEGFRKGKAPVNLAKSYLDPNQVSETALDIAIRSNVPAIFEQAKLTPLEAPHFEITKYVPGTTLEFQTSLDVFPEVKLGNYKQLKVKKSVAKVTNKDIDEVLANIAKSLANKTVVQRAAQDGDEVIIDFEGKKDGATFEGGSAKDYRLILGSDQFIPGFEKGIIGHVVGDRFELNLTFPKDYRVKDLADAKVTFSILLKQVNEITPPALDDALAVSCGPFKNLQELRDDIKKNLQAQNQVKADNKYKDDLVNALVKVSQVAAPAVMIEDQLRLIRTDAMRNADSHGLSFDKLIEVAGQTKEQWEKEAKRLAAARVKASLVLQTLAVEQKIKVAPEEVTARVNELKLIYKKDKAAVKQLSDRRTHNDIANRIMIEKTLDFLAKSQKPKIS